jgi:hypothetical protein
MMTSGSQRGQPGIWRSNRPHSWSNKMLEKKLRLSSYPNFRSWPWGYPGEGAARLEDGAGEQGAGQGRQQVQGGQVCTLTVAYRPVMCCTSCQNCRSIRSVCYSESLLFGPHFSNWYCPEQFECLKNISSFFRTRWRQFNGTDHAKLMWSWPLYEKWMQSVEISVGVMWREEILRE